MPNYIDEELKKKITPKQDLIFKKLFGTKGNEGILKDFLESVLEIEISEVNLDLNTEILPDFFDGKECRIDVRAKLNDGTEVDIEIQNDPQKFSEDRCLQYWSRLFSNTIKKGEPYENSKRTICIWIIDGEVFPEFENFASKWRITSEEEHINTRFNKLEFHIFELKKLRNFDKIKPSKKDFWLWFIDHTNEEMIKMACTWEERIAEARKKLDELSKDQAVLDEIWFRDLYKMDEQVAREKAVAAGHAEGRAAGKKEAQTETAKKLKEKGIAIEIIAEATGLAIEEIEKL